MTTGRACGKLILCGEHAVVYGHAAIAVPVDLHTQVEIEPIDGPLELVHNLFSPRDERRLEEALDTVFPDGGKRITVHSDLPVGVGLGSSAALAVAVARAAESDELTIRTLAMDMERVFHGNPSGLDVAVALRGETLFFEKGKPITVIPNPRGSLVAIDSGSAGNTAELVKRVADRISENKDIIEDIGALVHAARAVLQDPVSLGELLTENHQLLKKLGVSTPELDKIVDLCLSTGAYGAKLSGAGGGGTVLSLTASASALVGAAKTSGYDAWIVHESGP